MKTSQYLAQTQPISTMILMMISMTIEDIDTYAKSCYIQYSIFKSVRSHVCYYYA